MGSRGALGGSLPAEDTCPSSRLAHLEKCRAPKAAGGRDIGLTLEEKVTADSPHHLHHDLLPLAYPSVLVFPLLPS